MKHKGETVYNFSMYKMMKLDFSLPFISRPVKYKTLKNRKRKTYKWFFV